MSGRGPVEPTSTAVVVAAVVVTYASGSAELDSMLAALEGAGGITRIIVVDNGGAAHPSSPDVELIRMPNRGYGAGANVGIDAARRHGAELVAVLNDDIQVTPGWLDPLLAELEGRPEVGAAQPALIHADTDPPIINSLGVRIGPDGAGTDLGDGEPAHSAALGEARPVEIFSGGAVLFRNEFLVDLDGFDERYVLYYEDVDLALRGAERGWKYLVVPASRVAHARSSSTSLNPNRTLFLQERNRLWASVRFQSWRVAGTAFWLSVRRLRHQPRRVHARALMAGAMAVPRLSWERARAPRSRS
jgi:GT2 family glycosyltransferase